MYGVVTRNEEETEWSEFDRAFYEVKDVTGRAVEPIAGAVNMVSCFGDNAVESEEDLLAFDDEGTPATRNQPYFDWTYVCPTHDRYREGLLDIIEEAAAVNEDVRLDDVASPGTSTVTVIAVSNALPTASSRTGRPGAVTSSRSSSPRLASACPARCTSRCIPTLIPATSKPAPASPSTTSPSSSTSSSSPSTTWRTRRPTGWRFSQSWQDRLSTPFSIELYAVDVDVDDLSKAVEVAEEYAETVLFGYDASNARATIRRMNADAREGQSFGPE